jgi:hypothetical protein
MTIPSKNLSDYSFKKKVASKSMEQRREDLIMQMAFSKDHKEVAHLMNEIKDIELKLGINQESHG